MESERDYDPIHRILVGGILVAGTERIYSDREIETVVRVTARQPHTGYPDGVTVYAHPMNDRPRNRYDEFVEGAARVLDLLRGDDGPSLVHCAMCVLRSVGVAAAALAVHEGGPVDQWVTRLANHDRQPTSYSNTHDSS